MRKERDIALRFLLGTLLRQRMGMTWPSLRFGSLSDGFGYGPPSQGRSGVFLNQVGPFWGSKHLDGGVH